MMLSSFQKQRQIKLTARITQKDVYHQRNLRYLKEILEAISNLYSQKKDTIKISLKLAFKLVNDVQVFFHSREN